MKPFPLRLVIAALVLSASNVSSADYTRKSTPTVIYETVNLGGDEILTKVTPQPIEVTKIFKLITEKGTNKDPLRLAETIVYNSKRPLLMASIGLRESNFNEEAVSECGAEGIWQLMPEWHWKGYSPYDNKKNLLKAEEVLEIKIQKAKGNLNKGIALYTGVGKKAQQYKKNVLRTLKELKEMKV